MRCRSPLTTLALCCALLAASGCSVRKLAINKLGDTLAASPGTYARDDDPELVRDALPFALKTIEGLLEEVPENENLLLAACQGFTLYGAAFVELEAERLETVDYRAAERQYERALRMYLRAREYCYRVFALRHPGAIETLVRSPEGALGAARVDDVPLLFWTAGSWGSAISVGLDRPELVADLPAVRALLERALALDPDYENGLLHDAMVVLEAGQADAGLGSYERAREHHERALALSGGSRPGTYVTWAEMVSVPRQDRREFERLLRQALAVDPDARPDERLATLIQQDRARLLLERADEYFLEPLEDDDEPLNEPEGPSVP